jgi:hypothetical protein
VLPRRVFWLWDTLLPRRLRWMYRLTRAKLAPSRLWFFEMPRYRVLSKPKRRFRMRKGGAIAENIPGVHLPLLAWLPAGLLLPLTFGRTRRRWSSAALTLLLVGFGLNLLSGCGGTAGMGHPYGHAPRHNQCGDLCNRRHRYAVRASQRSSFNRSIAILFYRNSLIDNLLTVVF